MSRVNKFKKQEQINLKIFFFGGQLLILACTECCFFCYFCQHLFKFRSNLYCSMTASLAEGLIANGLQPLLVFLSMSFADVACWIFLENGRNFVKVSFFCEKKIENESCLNGVKR